MTVFTLLTLVFLLQFASSSYPSDSSPTPSPAPFISPSSPVAASPISPSHSPTQIYSPPAPPSSYLADSPSPTLSNSSPPAPTPNSSDSSPPPSTKSYSSSTPVPSVENQANHESQNYASEDVNKKSSGGHKLGVAFGVVGAACVVLFGGLVYKRRRENTRRSRYYSAGNIQLL